jgi:hypothetical protein
MPTRVNQSLPLEVARRSSVSLGTLYLRPTFRSLSCLAAVAIGSSVSKVLHWLDTENRIRCMYASSSTDVRIAQSILDVPLYGL